MGERRSTLKTHFFKNGVAVSHSSPRLRVLYVVFKGSWDMEKHRRSSPFLFGSFSFVDGGGIVDNFCRFCLSRGLVRGWNRRRRCFVPWDFVKPDTEIRPASCSGGPP